MRPARRLLLAFGICLLVLLACGTVTLGLSKAGHIAVSQHLVAEADAPPHGDTEGHRHPHVEHALHLLGACAAVLGAVIAMETLRRRSVCAAPEWSRPAGPPVRWSAVFAPRGLGPPARTALCVQLC